MSLDASSFYNDDRGTNYAQSRYLCYYLQQRGLLVKFYREFLARQKTDPTGYATLQRILVARDMAAFKLKWEKYVLSLQAGLRSDRASRRRYARLRRALFFGASVLPPSVGRGLGRGHSTAGL